MGFRNVVMMIPFCGTFAEIHRVYAAGIGREGLEVWVMCEIRLNDPGFARLQVVAGIDSISVTPGFFATTRHVAKAEAAGGEPS